ncbi:hypothetical protein SDC9_169319 [bioreactor metagenome]|uniref:Uncharacterized protein n=1 Tax=bioreactor metagenome TaxID=1076179 RepID=A0A645G4V7_9ZZZZ
MTAIVPNIKSAVVGMPICRLIFAENIETYNATQKAKIPKTISIGEGTFILDFFVAGKSRNMMSMTKARWIETT